MIIKTSHSCGCRGCGDIIPAHTDVVMASEGPFHIACAPSFVMDEKPDLELQFRGQLVVSGTLTGISYSFPGPDRRYRWSHYFIPCSELLKTSEAIRFNWGEYERLKSRVGHGSTVEKSGLLGMTIRVSLLEPGVWLFKRHIGVCSSEQANRLAVEYEEASQRLRDLLRQSTLGS